jgi:hypothetical protein
VLPAFVEIGLTAEAIASATNQSPERVNEILGEEWRRGSVVPTDCGWRLSDQAERRFGPALRALGSGPIRVGGRPRLSRLRRS